MKYKRLLKEIAEYVEDRFRIQPDRNLFYHNLKHTREVVRKAERIARHHELNETENFVLTAAAWFHDLGYLSGGVAHEERSAELASEFFSAHHADETVTELVKRCVLATRLPQEPATLTEQILCDADLYHLGTKRFFENDGSLRREDEAVTGIKKNKLEWYRRSASFLNSHVYFTDHCRSLLSPSQTGNLQLLNKKISDLERKSINIDPGLSVETAFATGKHEKKEAQSGKKDLPEKGIETMFRISSSNHQRLSGMADNKAHIMITVNSIILSAILSILLRRLTEYHYLLLPTCVLLLVSLLAMIFSILSTRPSLPAGTFHQNDVDENKTNLLFFGNYYRMPLRDFNDGMLKMMSNHDLLYGSLIRDIYAQGVILGKKYRLLRAAYNTFMFGLIIAILAFIIATVFYGQVITPLSRGAT